MAVIEYEEFFFCFWPFVNTQEILELPVKLNNPVIRLGPHYRLFIGRQFSWFLISMRTYVSAHTKAIVVGRQIDRKIVGIPIQQESWPTIDVQLVYNTSAHIHRLSSR
jgi:hypothetical protein